MSTPNGRFPSSDAQARSRATRTPQPPAAPQPQPNQRAEGREAARQRREAQRNKTTKTKVGGGFNPSLNPTISVNISKGGTQEAAAPQAAGRGNGTPGGDFMSNDDIRAWCEHVRKAARNRAVERAMDAEQLEAVLKRIPTSDGSRAGSMMRARRVSRHLKRIARAEQVVAKAAAAAYAQFEAEFEADLRKVGKARPAQAARFTF